MTVKEWLIRGSRVKEEIRALERYKDELLEGFTGTTAKLDSISVMSTKDPHKYDRYVELCSDVDDRLSRLYIVQREILNTINKLSDSRYRQVLIDRYVNMRTLEQTAVDLNYSYPQICRLQGEAFEALKPFIKHDIE